MLDKSLCGIQRGAAGRQLRLKPILRVWGVIGWIGVRGGCDIVGRIIEIRKEYRRRKKTNVVF